jgi:hypothetical protein
MKTNIKNIVIHFRVTDEEHDLLYEEAKEAINGALRELCWGS